MRKVDPQCECQWLVLIVRRDGSQELCWHDAKQDALDDSYAIERNRDAGDVVYVLQAQQMSEDQ